MIDVGRDGLKVLAVVDGERKKRTPGTCIGITDTSVHMAQTDFTHKPIDLDDVSQSFFGARRGATYIELS